MTFVEDSVIFAVYVTINRSGGGTPRHAFDKSIPFEFTIKISPPLKRGVDYGFKKKASKK